MASRIEGLDEKIIICAKEEFLQKGYEEASLRTIAQNAGTSTSAIYTRYSDKEGLFQALIKEAIIGLQELLRTILGEFSSLSEEKQKQSHTNYSDQGFPQFIEFIYGNFPEFQLLVTCSPTTLYQEFLEELVEIDTNCTKKFLAAVKSECFDNGSVSDGFLHVVSSAFYSGIFEVVIHKMTKEEATTYINQLRKFYSNGWQAIFSS